MTRKNTQKNIQKNSKKNVYTISGYDEKTILGRFMNGIEIDLDKLAEMELDDLQEIAKKFGIN